MGRDGPLGIALDIRANDGAARDAIEAVCSQWRAPVCDRAAPALELGVEILPPSGRMFPPRIRADTSRLDLAGGGVQGWADARLGRAACSVSRRWIEAGRFAEAVVEPLLLFLLSQRDRTPIHAAACVIDGVAIILAGPAGTGKSCLALAARQAGLPLLSDDTVHIQLRPSLRIWGLPRAIHVFPRDAPADAQGPLRRRNGKLKRAIEQEGGHPLSADRATLCLLARGDQVALEIVEGAPPALPRLEPGFDLLEAQSHAAYAALATRGFAQLTLGTDPREAIAALVRHRAELARIAA